MTRAQRIEDAARRVLKGFRLVKLPKCLGGHKEAISTVLDGEGDHGAAEALHDLRAALRMKRKP